MGSPVVVASPRKSPVSGRRINKPLVEKKRRARINGCLGQLKSLILAAMHTEQGAQVSRLEKADILEMTVNYLRQIQHQQITAVAAEPDIVAKFSAGYTECATEVIRYMNSVKCVAPEVKSRLESHLVDKLRVSVPHEPSEDRSISSLNRTSCKAENLESIRQIESTPVALEEMNRHYQTAVDLVNMASSGCAKENSMNLVARIVGTSTPHPNGSLMRSTRDSSALSPQKVFPTASSTSFCSDNSTNSLVSARIFTRNNMYLTNGVDPTPSQSVNLSKVGVRESSSLVMSSSVYENNDNRHQQLCVKSTFLSSQNSVAAGHNDFNRTNSVATGQNDFNNNRTTIKHLSNVTSNYNNTNNYINNFQRPLHIHIPDVPPPATSSPLQQHITLASDSLNSEPVSATVHTYNTDDALPTILYGCQEYHIQTHNADRNMNHRDQTINNRCYQINKYSSTTDNNINKYSSHHDTSYNKYSSTNDDNNIKYSSPLGTAYNKTSELMTTPPQSQTDQCHRIFPETERRVSPLERSPSPPHLRLESSYCEQIAGHHTHNEQTAIHLNSQNGQTGRQHHSAQTTRLNDNLGTTIYSSLSLHDRPDSSDNSIHLPPGLMKKSEVYIEHQTGTNNHKSTDFQKPQNVCEQSAGFHIYNRQVTTAGTMQASRECPSTIESYTVPVNNGLTVQSRVLPRQKDLSLSPPTLKKRLLQAHGSEFDWTTPRCTVDKSFPLDVGTAECGQTPRIWQDADNRTLLSRQTHALVPGVLFCTMPGHAISTDDGLWRPW